VVVAIGGGSVIDAGKAIAALLANPGDPYNYLEVVGRGCALERPSLPFIALPTTAGTGAEVTKNAVLQDHARGVKVSLRHETMLPRIALVDSELTWSVPPSVTAATGLDALTQVLEPYVSLQANPLTDALCIEALRRGRVALPRVVADGADADARDDMAFVSLCGGLALANAKLGAVHGLAAPLGGMYPAPHGAVCARLLPEVVRSNLRALQQREPANPALERYAEVARILLANPNAKTEELAPWLERLCVELKIAPLGSFGVKRDEIANVVAKAQRSSSMQGNPIVLSAEELTEIVERAL
jgi:alcohol dehydrogenase class IV